MPDFFAIIKPTRQDFLINPREEENKKMSEHFLYLKEQLRSGRLLLAGPTLIKEDPQGIYVLRTDSEEEAKKILDEDPAIKAGVQQVVEFLPFKASLYAGMQLD